MLAALPLSTTMSLRGDEDEMHDVPKPVEVSEPTIAHEVDLTTRAGLAVLALAVLSEALTACAHAI